MTMSREKIINIEFTWRGESINQFIPDNKIMEDIKHNKKYVGTIGNRHYKIDFNDGVVFIYTNGKKDPIGKADNFVLRFSERY